MVSIHIWGLNGQPSLISPESIAIYWFIGLREIKDLTIVMSNNTDLSPNQELPLLIDDEKNLKIPGFIGILDYLEPQPSLLKNALLEFTALSLSILTQYQLYLNKPNYEQFTRKTFSYLLYWPMWYNIPLKYRAIAKKKCRNLYYESVDDDYDIIDRTQLESAANLAQSKTFKLTEDKKRKDKELLTSIRCNSLFLDQLDHILTHWIEVREKLDDSSITSIDILLWAHMFVQLELPNNKQIRNHLEEKFPSFYSSLTLNLKMCTNLKYDIDQRNPNFIESGNIPMTFYNFLRRFV